MSFFGELKRRNVIRAGVAYMVAAWLLLQVVDVLAPLLELPDWVGKLVFLMLLIGLVPTLIFSWVYELTPDGLKLESEIVGDESIARHTARRLDRLTIALLVVVAGIVVTDRLIPETAETPATVATAKPEPASPVDSRPSLAVVPFVNTSDDDSNEYFADGISEELLNALSGIRNLRVPSRTSSFTFKGSNKTVAEIGAALLVENVLEGSVRKAGNTIRVTAQLIEVDTDSRLWTETYTRELDDIFAVQDEIASAIVSALRLALSNDDNEKLGEHSTDNVEAYDEYLLARHFYALRGAGNLRMAVEHLKRAVELDPEFDQAWFTLANVYITMPTYIPGYDSTARELSREALDNALSLNPESPFALTALAGYKQNWEFDWEGSNRDYERALALAPDYATARSWYGESLVVQGRLDEALEQLRLARTADPLSVVVRHVPGYFNLWSGRLDEAERHYEDVLALGVPFRWTYHNLDILNSLRGDYDEARMWLRRLADLEGFDPAPDLARIDAMENPDLKNRALELIEQRTDIGSGAFGKALQYALLGEYELALEDLEAGVAAGDSLSTQISYMVIYDPLRDNPRFQALLEKMNLAPEQD